MSRIGLPALLLLFPIAACAEGGLDLNGAPLAFVGRDRVVDLGAPIRLDGSKSADPEGFELSYRWSIVRRAPGSMASLDDEKVAAPILTVDVVGEYAVELIVNDGTQDSVPASLRIIVRDQNRSPIADAGESQAVAVGQTVELDGSASMDPEGAALTFQWRLEIPSGSGAALDDESAVAPTFLADVAGTFVATLVVDNGRAFSSPDAVTVVAGGSNVPPTARISGPATAALGASITLDGSASTDPDGDSLTLSWTVTAKPATSTAMLSTASGTTTVLTPDVPGAYTIELDVNDGTFSDSTAHNVLIEAAPNFGPVTRIDFRATDAEYSRALDRLVLISADPNRLHVYDAATHTDATVDLPLAPLQVSVAPDGMTAAVGHDGWVTIVDLDPVAIVKTIAMSARPSDTVLGGNGFVYGFPSMGQWTNIRSVDIAAETDTPQTGRSVRHGTIAKLHPNGLRMYGANNGLSPSDIERYNVTSGVAAYDRDSPYHGDYAMCGALWIADDGLRIFTRCGAVFRSLSDMSMDMTYNGQLMLDNQIEHLDHSSAAGRIAVVLRPDWRNEEVPTNLHLFDAEFLTAEGTVALPTLQTPLGMFQWAGRFAYYNSDGSSLIVVLQAEGGSGLLNDQAIAIF